MMDHEGYLSFFERFKKGDKLWLHPGKRIFYVKGNDGHGEEEVGKEDTNEESLFRLTTGKAGRSGRIKFCLVDWNNDGRTDILLNSKNAVFYENVKQDGNSAHFVMKQNVSEVELARHTTSPSVVDWNKDGIPELLLGAEGGHFYLFQNNAHNSLEQSFLTPPNSAKPFTGWHWIKGNVTKEGITLDLDAMADVGIGGFQAFSAYIDMPHGEADYLSPLWN